MALGFDKKYPVLNLPALREVIVSAVRISDRRNMIQSLKLLCGRFFSADIDLRVRKRLQLTGMIVVLMRQQDFRHLFRFVAQRLECIHVAADVFPHKKQAVFVRYFLRRSGGYSGVNNNANSSVVASILPSIH